MACAWCQKRSKPARVDTSTCSSIPRAPAACCWNWCRDKNSRLPRIPGIRIKDKAESPCFSSSPTLLARTAQSLLHEPASTIAAILQKHGLAKTDIDGFIVVSGPGSFTGLRVGLAAIKALAEILQKPIVSVSLLEVVAVASCAQGKVSAVLDARRGEVFFGAYEITGESAHVLREELLSRPEFLTTARGSSVATPDSALAA